MARGTRQSLGRGVSGRIQNIAPGIHDVMDDIILIAHSKIYKCVTFVVFLL
ncbi:hypothetical protein WP3W18E02_18490 [Klebsiella sp. WP3-W18-ESBL-02]|nr:hypothetical protein WP3W18E02_18490 [Klebsiella sp. WP3-W18-ESBL-02]BBR20415.1 hypothetical protein WP3S18E05_18950 [Klebsiella sp. WP3-S18-ESBL-05]